MKPFFGTPYKNLHQKTPKGVKTAAKMFETTTQLCNFLRKKVMVRERTTFFASPEDLNINESAWKRAP